VLRVAIAQHIAIHLAQPEQVSANVRVASQITEVLRSHERAVVFFVVLVSNRFIFSDIWTNKHSVSMLATATTANDFSAVMEQVSGKRLTYTKVTGKSREDQKLSH
jgi:preprotein translocase subunit SecY